MRAFIFAIGLVAAAPAFAQHAHQPSAQSGYAGMQERDIKALSAEQVADLRDGKGMGASLAAELNGVPGPLHVLQLRERLDVTSEQAAQLEHITAVMKTQARRLGEEIVAAEAALDAGFKSGQADKAFIQTTTARISQLQGELRAVHLIAHLMTRQVLSDQQVVAYNHARGYAAPSAVHKHVH
jgi:hypothetical protein